MSESHLPIFDAVEEGDYHLHILGKRYYLGTLKF